MLEWQHVSACCVALVKPLCTVIGIKSKLQATQMLSLEVGVLSCLCCGVVLQRLLLGYLLLSPPLSDCCCRSSDDAVVLVSVTCFERSQTQLALCKDLAGSCSIDSLFKTGPEGNLSELAVPATDVAYLQADVGVCCMPC
jgi:hypothetical protein